MNKDEKKQHRMTREELLKKQKQLQPLMAEIVGDLIDKDTYYSPIVSMSDFIADFSVGTAGIRWMRDRLEIFINLLVFDKLSRKKRRGTMKHELGHFILRHLTGSRRLKLEGMYCTWFPNRIHQMATALNIVEDLEINGAFVPEDELPEWGLFPEKSFGFPVGLLAEEYLKLFRDQRDQKDPDDINKSPEKGNGKPQPGGTQPGDGQPGGDEEGQGGGQPGDEEGDGQGEAGQQATPGDPGDKSDQVGGQGSDPWEDFKDMLDNPGGYPGIGDIMDGQEVFDESDEIMLGELLKDCEQKSKGNLPAGLERLLKQLRPPTIKWPRNLRNSVTTLVRSNRTISTWARPNRRGAPRPGNMFKSKPDCFVLQDTSGSMSDEELSMCSSEVYGMKKFFRKVWVYVCDAAVHSKYRFRNKIESLKGGGGSDFRPAFEAIAREGLKKPPVIILLTDGDIDVPNECPRGWEVFWVLTAGDRNVPYGRKIIIDRPEQLEEAA